MTERAVASKREGRIARFRRDPWGCVMNVAGGEWCGNTTAPCDHLTLRLGDQAKGEAQHVYNVNEDGGTLWIGYPDEWKWHMGRNEALRVGRWIVFRWWAWGEWFGLRRWVWRTALFKVCARHRSSPRSTDASEEGGS